MYDTKADLTNSGAVQSETVRIGRPVRSSRPEIPKMAQVIAAEIRDQILSGEVAPGDSLSSEAELLGQFDVSRPTLREALRLLEAQQLLVVRRGSHRGPVARHPDAWITAQSFALMLQLRGGTVADIYQFRMIFEPVAARMAAENATDEQLEALEKFLETELAAVEDFGEFTAVAWQFHTQMVALAGNRAMALLAETLERISQGHAAEYMANAGDSDEQGLRASKAMRRLVDLLKRRKGTEAEQYWLRHMTAAGERLFAEGVGPSPVRLFDPSV